MEKFFKLIVLCFCSALLYACSQETYAELPPALKADVESVVLPADAVLYSDPEGIFPYEVLDTVIISSTRSWSVSVKTDDGSNWISTITEEHINVTGQNDDTALVIRADRYKGDVARKAVITVYAAQMDNPLEIPIEQKAYAPVLEVSRKTAGEIPAINGECQVVVRANTLWTASIDPTSTANAELSFTSSETSKILTLYFSNNFDENEQKRAILKISADGCEEKTLEFIQDKSEDFFILEEPVPEIIKPYLSTIHIPLLSNGSWNAEISESTFNNAVLSPSAGTNSLSGFDFTANHGADPESGIRKAKIIIHRQGKEDIVVGIAQQGSIHIHVCELDPTYEWLRPQLDQYSPYKSAGNPFKSPASLPNTYTDMSYADQKVDCITKNGNFVFTMYGKDCGVWNSTSTTGLCVGKMQNDYILLPAIEGFRLSGMYYQASCNVATPYTVRTADGATVISGGEYSQTSKAIPTDTEWHDVHEHIFPFTTAGERYRINLEKSYEQISIKDLCLVYEKAE